MTASPARRLAQEPPLAAPPAGWFDCDRAARILGVSARSVQRDCAAGRLPARRVDGPRGPAWAVDPDGHPALRLSRGAPGPAPAAEVLSDLSEPQRRRLYRRHEMVEAYLEDVGAKPADRTLSEFRTAWVAAWNRRSPGAATSVRTLQRRVAEYERAGLEGLVDGRRGGLSTEASEEALDFLVGLYLSQNRPSLKSAYDLAAALAPSKGWRLPSLGHVRRLVRRRLDPKVEALGRDPRRYRDRCEMILRRDWSEVSAMELWVADHRQLDILLPRQNARGDWSWQRPWLTAFIDARSWYPVAWTLLFDAPDANRVMATFVRGVADFGLPGWLYLDNGKDFRAGRFAGGRTGKRGRTADPAAVEPLLGILGVQTVWAQPYNARAKPIENWFRAAVAERFDRTWSTYCGSKPELRPERLKGLAPAEAAAAGLGIGLVREALARWLDEDWCLAQCPVRASRGFSTARAFRDLRAEGFERRAPDPETLRFLLLPTKPVAIRQDGLHVPEFEPTTYWAAELEDRRAAGRGDAARKVVLRYDPADPSCVHVFDSGGRFLATAGPYLGAGVHPLARAGSDADREKLACAIAAKRDASRDDRRRLAEYHEAVARHAPLLAAQAAAGRALGRRDAAGSIRPEPQPVLVILPEPAKAAASAARHPKRGLARPASITAADLLAAHDLKEPGARERRSPTALDLLATHYKETAHATESASA